MGCKNRIETSICRSDICENINRKEQKKVNWNQILQRKDKNIYIGLPKWEKKRSVVDLRENN